MQNCQEKFFSSYYYQNVIAILYKITFKDKILLLNCSIGEKYYIHNT